MEWTRGRRIGHGSSATVSTATLNNSGEIFAVKSAVLHRSGPLQHEQRILSSLNCPHIVGYKGHDITRESSDFVYNLFMEYLPRGTLSDEMRKNGGSLDEPAIARYSRQILAGLDYLHSRGIVHCDIKGQNILVGDNDGGAAKIADFGCARSGDVAGPCCGTPAFMAPEVARGEEQSTPADVWAFGCTVVEMAAGRPPWGDGGAGDPLSVLYRIGFSHGSPEIPRSLSVQAKDFLEKCLRRNPEDRWTTGQLLNHPFLAGLTCSGPTRRPDPKWGSPTSVLDLGFWNSVETEPELIAGNYSGSYDLRVPRGVQEEMAADRIGQLAGSSGRVPEWVWDDGEWVGVRWWGLGGGDEDEEHGIVGWVEEVGMGSVGNNDKLDMLGGWVIRPRTNVNLDYERHITGSFR